VEQWFQKGWFSACVNGQKADVVWTECLNKYRAGSLPSAVIGTQRPLDSTEPFDNVSFSERDTAMETKCNEDDDIDAVLSSAGTFVREQKTFVSSLIGSHSAVCTSSQLLHSQEPSVDVTSDVPASANTTSIVDNEPAAACESMSHGSADSGVGRNKFPAHHSTGQLH